MSAIQPSISFNTYRLTVVSARGVHFECRYRRDDLESALEAIKNTLARMAGRCVSITLASTLDEAPQPETMAQGMERLISEGGDID